MMTSFRVFITGMQAVLSPKGLEMSSKPPLGSGLGILCAAKLWVGGTIQTKIIFSWHSTNPCRFKLTVSVDWTVSMQAFTKRLPERHRQILAHVSPGVDVFHFLAFSQYNRRRWSPWNFHAGSLWNRCRGSDSCMLLASGWSEPAVISFGPNSIGTDSSFGRPHSLARLSWRECCWILKDFDFESSMTSPESMRCLAQTSGHSKLRNCFHWHRKACRCHF